MKKTDDNQEIQNLKRTIEYATAYLQAGNRISYELVNEMHRIILESVRGEQKTPGQIRTTQNWIGPRGCTLEGATFVPPIPEEVYVLFEVFGFGDMEYFAGIKLFNKVIDRLGVDMAQQKRYEVFDRIYEASMREKKVKRDRNNR